jgi:hypothetical protein
MNKEMGRAFTSSSKVKQLLSLQQRLAVIRNPCHPAALGFFAQQECLIGAVLRKAITKLYPLISLGYKYSYRSGYALSSQGRDFHEKPHSVLIDTEILDLFEMDTQNCFAT